MSPSVPQVKPASTEKPDTPIKARSILIPSSICNVFCPERARFFRLIVPQHSVTTGLCKRHNSRAILGPVVKIFRLMSGRIFANARLVVLASRNTAVCGWISSNAFCAITVLPSLFSRIRTLNSGSPASRTDFAPPRNFTTKPRCCKASRSLWMVIRVTSGKSACSSLMVTKFFFSIYSRICSCRILYIRPPNVMFITLYHKYNIYNHSLSMTFFKKG